MQINCACFSRSFGLLLLSEVGNIFLQKFHLSFGFSRVFMARGPIPVYFFEYRQLQLTPDKSDVVSADMINGPSDS